MFDYFDDDRFETEATDEGFFRVYDRLSGLSADGPTADEAMSGLCDDADDFFPSDDSFGDF